MSTHRDCWLCEGSKLRRRSRDGVSTGLDDMYDCVKCHSVYVRCHRCRGEGRFVVDAEDNDKGEQCFSCMRHFCSPCWQSSGQLYTDAGGKLRELYVCSVCDHGIRCAPCLSPAFVPFESTKVESASDDTRD